MSKSMSKLDKLRQIVSEHQYQKIDGVIVDVVTANAILTIYDAMKKEENKEKYLSMDIRKMASVAWKFLN